MSSQKGLQRSNSVEIIAVVQPGSSKVAAAGQSARNLTANRSLPANASSSHGDVLRCPICTDSLQEISRDSNRTIVTTKCGHVFCQRCLEEALRTSPGSSSSSALPPDSLFQAFSTFSSPSPSSPTFFSSLPFMAPASLQYESPSSVSRAPSFPRPFCPVCRKIVAKHEIIVLHL